MLRYYYFNNKIWIKLSIYSKALKSLFIILMIKSIIIQSLNVQHYTEFALICLCLWSFDMYWKYLKLHSYRVLTVTVKSHHSKTHMHLEIHSTQTCSWSDGRTCDRHHGFVVVVHVWTEGQTYISATYFRFLLEIWTNGQTHVWHTV